MAIPAANVEREQLLKLADEYRDKGYDVSIHPNSEDLPDFFKNYCPDMIARRGNEAVIVEVKSRSSLDSFSRQYLQNLAQTVEQHPGWRFEFVMINPEDAAYPLKAESSLQQAEIETRLSVAWDLARSNLLELAILYSWSLAEATLRLITEHEGLNLQKLEPSYLIKQLATEGMISQSEYWLLMDMLSLRNAIAHGFKTAQLSQESVHELINITETLLKSL